MVAASGPLLVTLKVKTTFAPVSGTEVGLAVLRTVMSGRTSLSWTVCSLELAERSTPSSSTAVTATWLVQDDGKSPVWLTEKVQVRASPGESVQGASVSRSASTHEPEVCRLAR